MAYRQVNYSSYRNITAQSTVTVKAGTGVLRSIVVNKATANGTITIWDNTAASGTKIATITFPAATNNLVQLTLDYYCKFTTGLTIVMGTADSDITVVFE